MTTKRHWFQTEETKTVTTVRKGWVEIDEDFTQVYDSFLALSKDLQYKVSWQLLFWLFKQMNDNNGIQIGKHTFETFNKYLLIDCPDCVISRPTFDRAVNDLINVKVLTKVGKGFYYLNPHLFWKGSKKNRIEFIKDENKEARYLSHNPSNQLVDETTIQIKEANAKIT